MVAPMLPEMALAPLRAIDEAGLTHTAVLETASRVRGPGAVYVTTWVSEDEQPARLNPASQGGTNLRADQPSPVGDWILSLRAGSAIHEGQRVLVSGTTSGVAWQRLVSVSKVLFPRSHELRRRALCTDVEMSP